jgi:predicted cupin superfamily sugar epimerase
MIDKVEKLKALLGLVPLPGEGGFYVETFRCDVNVAASCLPGHYAGERSLGTAIYYLLTPNTFSAMHQLRSDEIYHFYLGDPIELVVLQEGGPGEIVTIGSDITSGMRPQFVVPRGAWQGSRLRPGGEFALLGTTVIPGFEFSDWNLGERDKLQALFPQFARMIEGLTR